jgi:predicted metal-binding protein
LKFERAFNAADGPQTVVVVPELSAAVPAHKKAEIELQTVKCVANCDRK